MQITRFKYEYDWLSNSYPCKITYEGRTYPSLEHAYQASKTIESLFRETIGTQPTLGKAKRIGGRIPLRPNWNEIKPKIMLELLEIKFQNPILRAKLLSTGDTELIEGNYWGDTYWGIDLQTQKGLNFLGKFLMLIRKRIKEEKK